MNAFEPDFSAQEYFLGLLGVLSSKGYFAYKEYLKFGRKLGYAITIKRNNESIEKLISKNIHLFDEQQQNDLLAISSHINSWIKQWDFLYKKSHPKPDDEFVFSTLIKFPKKSLERLDNYFFLNFNKKFPN
jgi:hypothetical protein